MTTSEKLWRHKSPEEKSLLRDHLENLWETQDHPKRDLLWGIAFDLGSTGDEAFVEEIYSRLISLVK